MVKVVIPMVLSNAYYKVFEKVYYVDQFNEEIGDEKVAYIQETIPQKTEGKYASYNQNTYQRLEKWKTVNIDFFDSADFLNSKCKSCIYFKKIISPYPLSLITNPGVWVDWKEQNTFRGFCALRNLLNYEDKNKNHNETELYCNCQFHSEKVSALHIDYAGSYADLVKSRMKKLFRRIDHEDVYPKMPIAYLRNRCLNPYQFEYLKQHSDGGQIVFTGGTSQFEAFFEGNSLYDIAAIQMGIDKLQNYTLKLYYDYVIQSNSMFIEDGSWYIGKTNEDGFFICGESKIVEAIKQLDF